MQTIYQNSWKWFLVVIFMVPPAYGQNETILVANFIHGNTTIFRSRVYLWNPSTSAGDITVRVFTMPRPGPFDPSEPSELLGTLELGRLEAKSARTIRIEEVLEVLSELGTITQPYEENGGNLMLEFTVGANGVRGTAQVFNNSFTLAFGTYPLQVISATGTNTATGSGALQNNTTGTDNTATGNEALQNNTTGSANTASGFSALFSNTTGSFNTASGFSALFTTTTGRLNTAMGWSALQSNTTGLNNNAVGRRALFSNTTGSENTAVGNFALANNTTANLNTAVGPSALRFNTTGFFNTAVGSSALRRNTTGGSNTAIGNDALSRNTTGTNNTASGVSALLNNRNGFANTATGFTALQNNTGSFNIAVGHRAGFNATTGDNNIYIGHDGAAGEAHTIRIGDSSRHFSAAIAGVLVVPASSKRFKEDIHDMGEASTGLMRLRPVTFRYKKEYDAGDGQLQYGLIAEEVAEVYPELVVNDDQGRAKTVVYQQLPAIMLNELQKQHRQVQELTKRLARLEQVLTAQQTLAAVTQ